MSQVTKNTESHDSKNEIGSVRLLRKKLWRAITKAEQLIDAEDSVTALKAVNSMATSAGIFLKCYQTHVLEKRLEQLELLLPSAKLEDEEDNE